MKNLTKVSVTLVQENGEVKFTKEINTIRASEISGTIAQAIIDFKNKAKKFKIKLDGFSFSRKFTAIVKVNETEMNGSDIFGFSEFTTKFECTLNNELNFRYFVQEYVDSILFASSEEIYDNNEAIEELIRQNQIELN
jgi:hypothetical protein